MAASPSEYLTFYRRLAVSTTVRRALNTRPVATRPFSSTVAVRGTGDSSSNQHATRKEDSLDIQSNSIKSGTKSKEQGTGGAATSEKDSSGGVEKTKKTHPEAPDPAIGMQDERGGKA